MQNSSLVEIFEKLTKKERFLVQKAVFSPFYNQKEEVTALWQLLCESENAPSKETAFLRLFPNEKYEVQKIYTAMSHLLALIERVLVQHFREQDEAQQKIDLGKLYRKKGLNQHFQTAINEAKILQAKSGRKDARFYHQLHQIELENYEFNIVHRTTALHLQALNDTLDTSFIIEKLKQTCILLSHQSVFNTQYEMGLIQNVLDFLAKNPDLLALPSVAIHYYCYLIFAQPTEPAHFVIFKQLLLAHYALFTESDIRDLYLSGINYCIKKHNARQDEYAREGLELYKKALEKGFLLENDVLSRFSYRNIVAWALLEKEYEWTERFIHDYKKNLERTYRDSMFSFSLARLEYSRKNYEAALLLLQKAEYRDILLGLAAKVILLKIYYETAEYEALEAHLASMKTYLLRKRVMGYHKTNYQKIIRYTQLLIKSEGNETSLFDLKNTISQDDFTEKEWFLEQF
jgi:hypothetical protein